MKKLVVAIFALLAFSVSFFGCSDAGEFWIDTKQELETVLGTSELPKNQDLFGTEEIEYSNKVQALVNGSDNTFNILKDYEFMLYLSMNLTKSYYTNFEVASTVKDSKEVQNAHKELNAEVKTLYAEISEFKSAKQSFETSLNDISDYTTENVKQIVKNYKRSYSDLILKTSEVNALFHKAYVLSYDIDNLVEPDIAFAVRRSVAEVAHNYFMLKLGEFDGQYEFRDTVLTALNNLIVSVDNATQFATDKFETWKSDYTKLMIEKELYLYSLEKIDFANIDIDVASLEEKACYAKIENFQIYLWEVIMGAQELIVA